jgi:ATP-binding cassette subfamily B protein
MLAGLCGRTDAGLTVRLMNVGFQQLRDVIFAKVGNVAARLRLRHLHPHSPPVLAITSRKTGGLSRIIERGVSVDCCGFVVQHWSANLWS